MRQNLTILKSSRMLLSRRYEACQWNCVKELVNQYLKRLQLCKDLGVNTLSTFCEAFCDKNTSQRCIFLCAIFFFCWLDNSFIKSKMCFFFSIILHSHDITNCPFDMRPTTEIYSCTEKATKEEIAELFSTRPATVQFQQFL